MDSPAPQSRFETEIARYNRWREELTQSVHAYHEWLESNGQLDVQQSIRFYDLLENLNIDPVRLAQVFGNLLTNAAKFMPADGSIRVTARVETGNALITISDDGVGIDADLLPHVFELFVQGEHAAANGHGGLGIGLTLVKNLVEMHGGAVHAKSSRGQGSSFTVRLPLLAEAEAPVDAVDQLGPYVTTGGARLLVVDDNRDAADTLTALLRLWGHDVRTAYDGHSALEMARAHRPALVFLDIGMPDMDGYEVARRLRAMPELHEIVLAALSGWAQESDRRRSKAAGFDHHLVKPPSETAIEQLIAALSKDAATCPGSDALASQGAL